MNKKIIEIYHNDYLKNGLIKIGGKGNWFKDKFYTHKKGGIFINGIPRKKYNKMKKDGII